MAVVMVQNALQSMAKLHKNRLFSKKMIKFAVMIVVPYSSEMKTQWDAFVEASRNATFLLRRDYMDYHAHRFTDASLMLYVGSRLMALLPASAHGAEVRSHGGLTYGGLVMPYAGAFTVATAMEAFRAIAAHYAARGFHTLTYKAIPHIYHRYPSEEDVYALWHQGAQLLECNVASTIYLPDPIAFGESSRRNRNKALRNGLQVREHTDFAAFWAVLEQLLRERYATAPVHSLEEITRLRNLFPRHIRLFCAEDAHGRVLGGMVLYFCGPCIHAQYTAATPEGKKLCAIAAVADYVLANECSGARYFDFGTCNEDHGRYLNTGLIEQKNGFGGRAIVYPTYSIDILGNLITELRESK